MTAKPQPKPRVLYVDDERENLVAFKYAFRDDYDVGTALSGEAALEMMADAPFDVVISDQRMPGMTGVELLEQINRRYPAAIRMILTGFSDLEAMVGAVNKGRIHHYFQKPWDEHELRTALARALQVQEIQRSVRRERRSLKWVIEAIPDGVLILDDAHNIRLANKRMCVMTGYSVEALQEFPVGQVIPAFVEQIRPDEIAAGGGPRTVGIDATLVCQHKDGIEFPVEITVSSETFDGESRLIAAVRDVSIQRRLAHALVESEEKLREAQSVARVGHWELDHSTGRLVWSEQVYRVFGCEPRDFDGTVDGLIARIHPDDRDRLIEAFGRHLDERWEYDVEHRIVLPHGGERHVHERCFTSYDEAGQPVRSLGTVQDITDRRLADLELERHRSDLEGLVEERTVELWAAHEKVHKSEERYRALLGNISAGVVVADAEGRVAYCNAPAAAMLRRTSADLVGRSGLGADFHYLPKDGLMLPTEHNPIDRVYETRAPLRAVEVPISFDDGSISWILGDVIPLFDTQGEIREVIITAIEITELKRAQADRARDEERLEASLELASEVTESGELEEMEQSVLKAAAALTHSPLGCIHHYDENGQRSRCTVWSEIPHKKRNSRLAAGRCPVVHGSVWEEVQRTGKLVIQNQHRESADEDQLAVEGHLYISRFMGLPLFEGDRLIAVIGLCNKSEAYDALDARQVDQFMGTAMALLRRFEAEQAMRKSEENFRTLVTEITDGFYTTDDGGRITFANPAFAGILRFEDPGELVGAPLWNLLQPAHRPSLEASYSESLSSGRFDATIESEVIRADGTSGFVEIRPAPILVEGEAVGSRGVVRDITERRKAEAEMRKLSRAVWASPIQVIVTDGRGRIEYVNPKFTEVTGYSFEEVAGENPRILSTGVHDGRFYTEMWNTISSGQDWHGELCNRKKNGQIIWENASISPILGDEGEITHYVAVKEDITEARLVREELSKAKEAADAANKAKSAFLANMSHEIRTPMNAILGYSQLMQRTSGLDEQQQDFLRTINRSGEHLLVLINDVLEMSKIESGQTEVVKKTFDLFGLLDDVERMFLERTRSKKLQLTVEKSDVLAHYLFSDEAKVRQVLINVVGNAVKFTEKGRVALRAASEPAAGGLTRTVIEVEDTGPGIPEGELENIFQAFAQTDVGREHGGSGLGMAISRKFAQQLDGDLSVTSEVGQGSVFRFEFRAQEETRTNLVSLLPPRRAVGIVPGQRSKRVLVVDDKASNRDVLVHILTPLGFVVDQAADGQEALASMLKWMPDAVLMDMQMPVMDGKEATRRIRSMPDGRDVPILMVTASAMEENREEALIAGADGFIRKPYREDEILTEINRVTGVQYVFEHAGSTGGFESPSLSESVQCEVLSHLEPELVADMRASIEAGDMEQFAVLIEQVRLVEPQLAAALAESASQFEYDQLLDLLESAAQGDD